MTNSFKIEPENTAVRVALWRALHLQTDSPPHVFEDDIGLKLVEPEEGWQNRPDMSPFTKPFRASILARARFIEDLITEQFDQGLEQYIILGAGLDTFAQRKPTLASQLQIFEIDQPGPQSWKQQRLAELGYASTPYLKFVPVDFEAGDSWWDKLVENGFDSKKASLVASTGVSMYLTKEAIMATLVQIAENTTNSTFVMSFMLPIKMADPELRPGIERAAAGAKANGTPFLSFFMPSEILEMAKDAGFHEVQHVSAAMLAERYFSNREDGLRPPNNAEELLIART